MDKTIPAQSDATVEDRGRSRAATIRALVETTKPRITRMVTVTSGVGFILAALLRESWTVGDLAITATGAMVGTALSASGANSLNQWMERGRDALMPRTCSRPLPTARVEPSWVLGFGVLCAALGVGVLAWLTGVAPALVSLATVLIYVLVYTPSKPLTPASTLVGAVPGALPPLIGWCAAHVNPWDGLSDLGGWSLFLLMFIWQIPHFLAIAWLYREDYARGGHRVLPVLDPSGVRTSAWILGTTALLVPATILPGVVMPGLLGWVTIIAAVVTGSAFGVLVARLARSRTREAAKRVFIASVIHLPILLVVMVSEALWRVLA